MDPELESSSCCAPPGFRFHPTEEELVGYYLARKVASQTIEDIIQEVDLYRMEPWDLVQVLGGGDIVHEQQEWYFFSYKDRKYPSGTRTNRATAAGFWKATGRDKPVMSRSGGSKQVIIGMRKTLVFYKGRAPHGRKTDWIMHEYRLQSEEHAPAQEEGWVVCRAFQKPVVPNNNLQHMMMMYPSLGGSAGSYHYLGSSSSSLIYPPPAAAGTHHDVESKTKLMSIPQLIDDDGYCQQQPPGDELTMIQGGGGGQPAAAAAIDWNFLDTLLSSTIHDPSIHPLN